MWFMPDFFPVLFFLCISQRIIFDFLLSFLFFFFFFSISVCFSLVLFGNKVKELVACIKIGCVV
jgi:hypothetical protein